MVTSSNPNVAEVPGEAVEQFQRGPTGCHFFFGVQNVWDTTFREGGAYSGTQNFFLGRYIFLNYKNFFFWDTNLFSEFFRDTQFFLGYKFFWLTKIPEHHTQKIVNNLKRISNIHKKKEK